MIKSTLNIVLVFCLLLPQLTLAQPRIGQDCRYPFFNTQGTDNADIVVSSTAVVVLDSNGYRCSAIVTNTGAGNVRCADSSLTPTSTKGQQIKPGQVFTMNTESAREWKCIRESGDSTVNVTEIRTQ